MPSKFAAMRRSAAASASAAAPGTAMARTLRMARQSGSLNLSSRDLVSFPDEVFRLYEQLDDDERSWECAVLRKLDLSYNDIVEIPSQVETLKYLVNFKMRHNHLRQVPLSLWNVETLTLLDLSNNDLGGCLPEDLGKLYKLRELGLEGNKLTHLPESLGALIHLEVLRVESNHLTMLPSTIGYLRSLKSFSAYSNQITELPLSFGELTNLQTVDLKKNCLVTTHDAFRKLVSIKYIDLRQNKLTVFPMLPEDSVCLDQLFLGFNMLREIPEHVVSSVMESLTVLDVSDNKLQQLSDGIPRLYRLKTLDVSNNDLHDLPAGLGYLKYLDHLLVEGNPLRSIRRSVISSGTEPLKKYLRTRGGPPVGVDAIEEEVDEFTMRQREAKQDEPMPEEAPHEDEYLFREAAASGKLQLVDMRLQHLPTQLHVAGKYRFNESLQQLDLSKNWLQELPAAIGDLTSLHTLTAVQCGLKSVHSSIAMLPSLKHLRLSKNSLTTDAVNTILASDTHGVCLSLTELDLRNNMLTDIPQNLQHLKSIDTLVLSFNRLRVLDGFPWSTMRHLSVLSIADNRLESCGTVYQVPKLTSLSLENNELRQIPAELALCESLRALYLAGNPQRGIRAHVLNSGTEAVLKYLRSRLPPDASPLTVSQGPEHSAGTAKSPNCVNRGDERVVDPPVVAPTPNAVKPKRLCVDLSTSSPRPLSPATPSTGVRSLKPATASAPVEAAAEILVSSAADEVLAELDVKIQNLEQQLDDFAVTAAKRFALKKDLAMTRSLKIRHMRMIGQKS
uniref:Disease resistance R13L4/SHOC-2-like LRR domain-containing protein n=1 Tax=Peronospora matthiolae TaxID=2874970 RepID=A0AAV1VEW8_9STRA